MLLTIITIVFMVVYTALIFFYYIQWKKLKEFNAKGVMPDVFISVIIAARNEERTLPLLLNDLVQQDYPRNSFEVIVVNDHSTDKTAEVINAFYSSNMKMVLPDSVAENSSKKIAIAAGIKEAKGELIVITDADCRVNTKWLLTIVSFHQVKDAAFIAAPVRFQHDNSLLQIFQSLDFLVLQGITAASVSSHFHNMCNGANLAYTKQAFIDVNGFEGIDKVATGDDMLLMHKISEQNPNKVFYLKSNDAIVNTQPMPNWKDFLMQRRRWASKALVYDDFRIIFVLSFVYLFNLLFFVLVIVACVNSFYWWYVLFFVILKTIIEFPFVSSVAGFYEEKKLMWYFLPFQLLHIFYTGFVGLISQFGKYEWKGRRTR